MIVLLKINFEVRANLIIFNVKMIFNGFGKILSIDGNEVNGADGGVAIVRGPKFVCVALFTIFEPQVNV